ncbi:chorismate mutase [Bombilactobacillus bombi]|uniref:chorismate mutase n=1 Tax=Bombilactobacillus bombi TaxID=1303590 RepID=UPI0015E5FF0B|nr:hypothetical protein [Bombilactobacillus bombi]
MLDKTREKEVLQRLEAHTQDKRVPATIKNIYQEIVANTRQYEQNLLTEQNSSQM